MECANPDCEIKDTCETPCSDYVKPNPPADSLSEPKDPSVEQKVEDVNPNPAVSDLQDPIEDNPPDDNGEDEKPPVDSSLVNNPTDKEEENNDTDPVKPPKEIPQDNPPEGEGVGEELGESTKVDEKKHESVDNNTDDDNNQDPKKEDTNGTEVSDRSVNGDEPNNFEEGKKEKPVDNPPEGYYYDKKTGKMKRSIFAPPKTKKWRDIIKTATVKDAKESVKELTKAWNSAKTRDLKRRLIRYAVLAENRVKASLKRKKSPLKSATKKRKIKVARVYGKWIDKHSLSKNPPEDRIEGRLKKWAEESGDEEFKILLNPPKDAHEDKPDKKDNNQEEGLEEPEQTIIFNPKELRCPKDDWLLEKTPKIYNMKKNPTGDKISLLHCPRCNSLYKIPKNSQANESTDEALSNPPKVPKFVKFDKNDWAEYAGAERGFGDVEPVISRGVKLAGDWPSIKGFVDDSKQDKRQPKKADVIIDGQGVSVNLYTKYADGLFKEMNVLEGKLFVRKHIREPISYGRLKNLGFKAVGGGELNPCGTKSNPVPVALVMAGMNLAQDPEGFKKLQRLQEVTPGGLAKKYIGKASQVIDDKMIEKAGGKNTKLGKLLIKKRDAIQKGKTMSAKAEKELLSATSGVLSSASAGGSMPGIPGVPMNNPKWPFSKWHKMTKKEQIDFFGEYLGPNHFIKNVKSNSDLFDNTPVYYGSDFVEYQDAEGSPWVADSRNTKGMTLKKAKSIAEEWVKKLKKGDPPEKKYIV